MSIKKTKKKADEDMVNETKERIKDFLDLYIVKNYEEIILSRRFVLQIPQTLYENFDLFELIELAPNEVVKTTISLYKSDYFFDKKKNLVFIVYKTGNFEKNKHSLRN